MRERPILFSAPMIRALLAGTKTQTRRIVKWEPGARGEGKLVRLPRQNSSIYLDDERGLTWHPYSGSGEQPWPGERVGEVCPYGGPGDRLWVRETWQTTTTPTDRDVSKLEFAADWSGKPGFAEDEWTWRPSIFMPRWASRISLDVTAVRVERLHAITDDDAKAEGAAHRIAPGGDLAGAFSHVDTPIGYRNHFADLWRRINGAESWDANPWVWVVEFKRAEAQERAA